MCCGNFLIINIMDKLFSNKQLDKAIDDLPNNGNAKGFNSISDEERKYVDSIYRHLKGKGIVKIQEAGGHIICASLTDYGISFRFDGGFKGFENNEKSKLLKKFRFDIISVVVGTILGYALGVLTVILIK